MVVSDLFLYPIKSCRGVRCTEVTFDTWGVVATNHPLYRDRGFMLVREESGVLLSQRDKPSMALIEARYEGNDLVIDIPGQSQKRVSLLYPEFSMIRATVHNDTGLLVADQGDDIAEYFSAYLGINCRLVSMAHGYERPLSSKYAPRKGLQVGLADGYPALMLSLESIDDLNQRITDDARYGFERFRPNIVFKGGDEPYIEDTFKEVIIGESRLYGVKWCKRCPIPQIDQRTGRKGKEPAKTLLSFRCIGLNERGDPEVIFGQNFIPGKTGKMIRIDNQISIMKQGIKPTLYAYNTVTRQLEKT